jgi:tripartite motif-containing protein 71
MRCCVCSLVIVLLVLVAPLPVAGRTPVDGATGRNANGAWLAHAKFVMQIDGLASPMGAAIDGDHNIYIAEAGRHRIAVFDVNGKLLRRFGTRGDGDGQLLLPGRVAVNPQGEVIVADVGNRRAQVFTSDGRFIRMADLTEAEQVTPAWLTKDALRLRRGSRVGQFNQPGGFVMHGESFIVADTHNHRLQLLTADGEPISVYARTSFTPHEGTGALRAPTAVAVSPDGSMMAVCEVIEQRCQLFSLRHGEARNGDADAIAVDVPQLYGPRMAVGAGCIALFFPGEQKIMVIDAQPPHHAITEFGEFGTRFGQFEDISDMVIYGFADPSKLHLLIADANSQRLVAVRIDKQLQNQLGLADVTFLSSSDLSVRFRGLGRDADAALIRVESIALSPNGATWFTDARRGIVSSIDSNPWASAEEGKWRWPVDLEIDRAGSGWHVLDAGTCTLTSFSAQGKRSRTIGGHGDGEGELLQPTALAVAPDGTIFVCDAGRSQVVCFSADGAYQRRLGKRGSGDGEFALPTDIAMTGDGRVAVLDQGHQRVIFFDESGRYLSHFGVRGMAPLPEPTWRD